MLMVGAETGLAGSAQWDLNPGSGDWNTAANWTPMTVPNGPSDTATFAATNNGFVDISANTEVNGIAFTSTWSGGAITVGGVTLTISGVGITTDPNNTNQAEFDVSSAQIIFSNSATAGSANIENGIDNGLPTSGETDFHNTSTAGGATIFNVGDSGPMSGTGVTQFFDVSTASNATLIAAQGVYSGGAVFFSNGSIGGTARVELFGGSLDISNHNAPGVTIGSIEGDGNVFLGANNLTVGSNNLSTTFAGVIQDGGFNGGVGGSFTKIGSGILTFQGRATNDYIADTVTLGLVSGSIINLNFSGPPDVIAYLFVNGVLQPTGLYGGPASGAPHQLPEFAGTGTVQVGAATARGDFNGDGFTDYLLFNSGSRATAIWYLHGATFLSGAYGPTLPAGWVVADVADFNVDGHPDYALFNASTRQTAIWYLNNNVYVSGAYGPTLPSGWELVATGDFNNDGKPDYVLYNASTHQTAIWDLNNNVYIGGGYGPTLPAGWRIVGVADFNGDGNPDYLLFNASTRGSAIWYLSGRAFVSGVYGPTIASGYVLTGAADFNGDGKPDYALFNASSRQTAIWYMNNNVYVSGAYGPTLPAGWSLVAP
jgi:hypothetical protein